MTDYDSPVQLSDGEHEPFIRRAAKEYPALSFVNILLRLLDAARERLAERDRQIAHEIYDKGKIQRRHDFQANRASSAEAHVAVLEALLREAKEWIGWEPHQSVKGIRQLGKALKLVDKIDEALAAPAAPREEGT